MIKTENETLQLILLAAPLFAEITMLLGFFLVIIALLFHLGVF
tara:strand:- start:72 stop:200 length:129 start_codon:yes stop_codon:yes gene_type:complete